MSAGRFPLIKIAVLVLIVIIVVGGYRFLITTRPSQLPVVSEESEWPVNTERVRLGNHAPVIILFGRVESPNATRLVAAINADVLSIPVREAEQVPKDQLLIRLDDQDAKLILRQREAEYLDAKAQLQSEIIQDANNQQVLKFEQELLRLTQKELERVRRLNLEQLASQNLIDTAQQAVVKQQISLAQRQLAIENHVANKIRLEANVEKAQTQRDLANLELKRAKISTPFPAIITRIHVAPGMRVRAGDALVDLYEEGRLEVRAQVPGIYLSALRSALSDRQTLIARISPETASDESTIHATMIVPAKLQLDRLTGDIKDNNSSVEALFTIQSDSRDFALGQVLKLYLELAEHRDVFTLPVEAIYGSNRIFKIIDGRLKSLTVARVGITYDNKGEERIILRAAEIQDQDQILATQLPNAIDGLKVKILP